MQALIFSAGKKASDNHAAVWVPDSEASTCMHCMRVKFTAINRRVRKDDKALHMIFMMISCMFKRGLSFDIRVF